MQDSFDTRIQVDEIHPEVDNEELRSLAKEYIDWVAWQLFSRMTADESESSP